MSASPRPDLVKETDALIDDIAEYVRSQVGGVDAEHLHQHFEERGELASAIRRAVRVALDRGSVRLGHALRFVAS